MDHSDPRLCFGGIGPVGDTARGRRHRTDRFRGYEQSARSALSGQVGDECPGPAANRRRHHGRMGGMTDSLPG